ncbi:hypothetical protein K2X33_04770, partial [bacterium]|nr:hypothetical protein [bacterium]
MKKPDLDKLKKQAGDLKNKATELGSEALKQADGLKKGVQVGVEVSKGILGKAGQVVNKNNLSTGIDAVA